MEQTGKLNELIKAIRENEECNNCEFWKHGECNERKMSLAAADALEAAEKRIAELSLDCELFQQKCMELHTQVSKEGEWLDEQRGRWIYAKCNLCGKVQDVRSNYCPNCGARMRGSNDEQIH